MPVFVYKAITENGTIVKNKVEDINRKSLIKKLKRNNLTPINVVQVGGTKLNNKSGKKQKRNVNDISDLTEGVNVEDYIQRYNRDEPRSLLKRLKVYFTLWFWVISTKYIYEYVFKRSPFNYLWYWIKKRSY